MGAAAEDTPALPPQPKRLVITWCDSWGCERKVSTDHILIRGPALRCTSTGPGPEATGRAPGVQPLPLAT
jgi:hypothetical protein